MEKKECTVKDLCEYYSVSRTTIERYMKKGMPFKRRGRSVIFVVADVDRWYKEKNKIIEYNYDEPPVN